MWEGTNNNELYESELGINSTGIQLLMLILT